MEQALDNDAPGKSDAVISKGDQSETYHSAPNQDLDGNKIDFLQDDRNDMTYGRRIALALMKYPWYNPQADMLANKNPRMETLHEGQFRSEDGYPLTHSKEQKASLEKAWAYL
jgi:hypothetical protein